MTKKAGTIFVFVTMSLLARSQSRPRQFAIPPANVTEAVTEAFSRSGIQLVVGQVSLTARLVATEQEPMFDIASVGPIKEESPGHSRESLSKVKVICHRAGVCLPFYVVVAWPAGAVEQTEAGRGTAGAAEIAADAPKTEAIRRGDRATLLLIDDRSQIQISVISLQSGAAGQTIRVMSQYRKHIYVAEIVSVGVLKGRF